VKRLVWLLALLASPAFAQIHIENAWSRATPPGTPIGVGYMTIRNTTPKPDKLIGASSPAAGSVETHVTIKDGDISRMRKVPGYDIPGNGTFTLQPGGAHLMLINLKAPLKEGETVPLTLKFQHAGEVKTELQVRALGATGGMGGMQGMGGMKHQ
jgi:copper(I)-binding protein